MKKILSILMVILILSVFIPSAFADADITVMVGEYVEAALLGYPEGVTVTRAYITSGSVPPGLGISTSGGATLLKGTARQAGEWSASGVTEYSDGWSESWYFHVFVEGSTTGSIEIGGGGSAAEIFKQPSGETVEAGGWAMFRAGAHSWESMVWRFYNPDTDELINAGDAPGRFEGLGIKRYTDDNDYQVIELFDIPASLNGWQVEAKYVGYDGEPVYSWGAEIKVNGAESAPTPVQTATPITTPPAPTPANNNGTGTNGSANGTNGTNNGSTGNNGSGSTGSTSGSNTPGYIPQYGVNQDGTTEGVEPTSPPMTDIDETNSNTNENVDKTGGGNLKAALAGALIFCVGAIGACMMVISRKK